jgi:23S rRNA (cytosine1962-C5)-methyltransferase
VNRVLEDFAQIAHGPKVAAFAMDTQIFIIPAGKILEAIKKRSALPREQTNALRLFDGSGDGLPGLAIDDFAGRWIVQTLDERVPALDPATGYRSLYWKRLMKTSKQGPTHLGGELVEDPFEVLESGLRFEIDFQAGYSPGLFLDQRANRDQLRDLAHHKSVLNTFSYTCAFGVAAAVGGAATVNLDLSRHYLDWGKRNYEINRISLENHDFIYGDVFDWLGRFQRRGRTFDLVVLDPPTFSRDRKSKVFRIQEDYGHLVARAAACLNRDGLLFCSANYRGMTFDEFLRILRAALTRPFKALPGSMPPDFSGDQYLKTVWLQF